MSITNFSNSTLKSYSEKLFKELTTPNIYWEIAEKEKQREFEQLKKDLSKQSHEELINACLGSFIFSYDLNKEKERLLKKIKSMEEDSEKLEKIKEVIGYYIDEEY